MDSSYLLEDTSQGLHRNLSQRSIIFKFARGLEGITFWKTLNNIYATLKLIKKSFSSGKMLLIVPCNMCYKFLVVWNSLKESNSSKLILSNNDCDDSVHWNDQKQNVSSWRYLRMVRPGRPGTINFVYKCSHQPSGIRFFMTKKMHGRY